MLSHAVRARKHSPHTVTLAEAHALCKEKIAESIGRLGFMRLSHLDQNIPEEK
jgi:hypothetical protein